jgi:NAD(P)-dependent dehydrogenase (short-subunit alcohol dehydrogenase family)
MNRRTMMETTNTPATVTDELVMEVEGGVLNRRKLLLNSMGVLGLAALGSQAALAQQTPTGQQPNDSIAPTASAQTDAGRPGAEAALQGRIAVVTGAARGIGRSIAVEFAANGADIIAIDIAGPVSPITQYPHSTPADLEETGRLVKSHGRKFIFIMVDIRDIASLRAAADRIEKEMGPIDIVVADAGIQAFKPLLEMEDNDWHDVIDVNLTGSANTIRAFAPALVKRGSGRIIVVASMQGRWGMKHGAAYSASKWGILGLMKSAALELGQYGITVNALLPGLIDTPMTRNEARWREAVGEGRKTAPEHPTEQEAIAALAPRSPLGIPWLTPDEVAPAAVFLASAAASRVTGAAYEVNGGLSAHDVA